MQVPSRARSLRTLSTLLLSFGLLLQAFPLLAQNNGLEQRIRALNENLLRMEARVRNNPDRAANERSQAMRVLAERRDAFVALITSDPETSVQLALPDEVLDSLRAAFPDLGERLERRGRWSGELEYSIADSEDLGSHTDIFKLHGNGRALGLYFAKDPDTAPISGQLVTVEGVGVDDAVAVQNTSIDSAAAAVCGPTGNQKTAVLRVTFPGVGLTSSRQDALDVFFASNTTSTDGYWQEASHGLAYASGDVFPTDGGAYTLDRTYTCDEYTTMGQKALQAADRDVDFSQYSRIFVLFPRPSGCGWAGIANVGCRTYTTQDGSNTQSMAYQEEDYMANHTRGVQLTIHEGGHNLGVRHATTRDFGSDPIGNLGVGGSFSEYGDPFSTMGTWNTAHYAAPHKAMLRWLSNGSSYQTIESSGTFTVQPVVNAPTGTQALKIRRGTGNNAWVWVEYRQPVGPYESGLNASVYGGALIHYEDSYSGGKTNLVDFTPGTSSFYDAALASGQSWDDPYSDLSISIGSASSSGLTVSVSYGSGGPSCSEANPTISLSPSSQAVQPGSSVTYDVSIRNNDSSGCGAAIYSLSSSQPSSWSSYFANSSLTVNPGATAYTTLTKTAPSSAALSTYTVNATATKSNASSGSYSATAQASASVIGATYTLSVSVSGTGSVRSTDGKINCSAGTCSASYAEGTSVSLTSTAGSGATFSGWGGSCSGTSSTCTVSMSSSRSVSASFSTVTTYTLAVSVSGAGQGTVTSSDGKINCSGGTCTANYTSATTVTLTASPGSTATFAGWGGACAGTSQTCTVTVNTNRSVSASFNAQQTYSLSISTGGNGRGTVTTSDQLINCGPNCAIEYNSPQVVTLTATPATGSRFDGWSGDCSGTATTCTVTVDHDIVVGAKFMKQKGGGGRGKGRNK